MLEVQVCQPPLFFILGGNFGTNLHQPPSWSWYRHIQATSTAPKTFKRKNLVIGSPQDPFTVTPSESSEWCGPCLYQEIATLTSWSWENENGEVPRPQVPNQWFSKIFEHFFGSFGEFSKNFICGILSLKVWDVQWIEVWNKSSFCEPSYLRNAKTKGLVCKISNQGWLYS